MPKGSPENAREKLLNSATELFRRQGYAPTTVDEICHAAGVTKGAFFYYFASKEKLAENCLAVWEQRVSELHESAPFQSIADPRARLIAAMEFFITMFSQPGMVKSCLAGTTAQEVAETHPVLRDAAQACFTSGAKHFQALLDAACAAENRRLDTVSLSQTWMATLQGSILLAKAAQNDSIIANSLRHFKDYVETLLLTPAKR